MLKVTFAGGPLTLGGAQVKVGDKAPDFTAVKQDLGAYNFYEATKGKVRIISSVPSLDTGVCALQTKRFNKEATELSKDVTIVTLSADLPFAQGRFCGAEGIDSIDVVSDYKDMDFGSKYGFGIDELRLLSRGIVVVDKDDTVKYVEYVSEITDHPDYDSALAAVKKIL